jgi:transcription factor SPEECHLESS
MAEALCDQLFADVLDGELHHPSHAEDLLGILEAWEDCVSSGAVEALSSAADAATPTSVAVANGKRRSPHQGGCDDSTVVPEAGKRQRCSPQVVAAATAAAGEGGVANTTATAHVAVERNRRKQMNEHLAVLRSLMPCFYVKRVRSYLDCLKISICSTVYAVASLLLLALRICIIEVLGTLADSVSSCMIDLCTRTGR